MTLPRNGKTKNQTIPNKCKCKKCGYTFKVTEENTEYYLNVVLIRCEKCDDCYERVM